ncbi:MAG: DNA-directed RNA Pol II C-term-like phosphatase [Solumvirus sp.]|uniref:DNA-directed RNA Pol II C-term-like phosphatase n=1 Tax=Solumvirus sp. TaxID=2487773 RepID=A0A3G5AFZ9_9VIRU|nr:MAG: DNA-directed RNA Pol II C-term-like phosphatase [Solumvirus sp.]
MSIPQSLQVTVNKSDTKDVKQTVQSPRKSKLITHPETPSKIMKLYDSPTENFVPISKQCIVLDMDETLVNTFDMKQEKKLSKLGIMSDPNLMDIRERLYHINLVDAVSPPGSGDIAPTWGITRPHLINFMKYVHLRFKVVIIWSAGVKRYVSEVIHKICKNNKMPHSIWNRSDCVWSNEIANKPISKIASHPDLSSFVDLNNTFFIDDLQTAFNKDNPHNGIQITPYLPEISISGLRSGDDALLKLMYWFSRPDVIHAKDIRQLDKKDIFTTSISEYQKMNLVRFGDLF